MSSIDTAIPLIANGQCQPLIPNTEEEYSEMRDIKLGDHEENKVYTNILNNTTGVSRWGQRLLTSWQFLNGFWLGFIIQTLSLGCTAIIAIYYGASEEDSPVSWKSKTNELFYFFFFIFSHSWWLLFPVICIAIDSGLTRQGTLEKCFLRSSSSHCHSLSQSSQREVFLGGVRFHVGIVFGCFIVWSIIDLYFGAPLGLFAALTASLLACLGLCYGMVLIYDRFIVNEEQQHTRQSLLEEL